jgi:Cu2+-exporting ATPase
LANSNDRALLPAHHARVLPGLGITGTVAGRALRLGRGDFATGGGEGEDDLLLADNEGVLARFQVHERIRADAGDLIDQLTAWGIESEILSGDARARVAEVASQLGVAAWRGRCMPTDKLARIGELRQAGHRVLVVGDGSNDAPVLAGADVSVALSSGSDLAQAQADIVLCSGRLSAIAECRTVARTTLRVLAQNQRWALSYNLCAMPLAAMGWVPPWLAAIGMSTSSLVVVLNALRIDRKRSHAGSIQEVQEGARL